MFGIDPIEQIRLAVEELACEDRREWSGAARSQRLVELIGVVERLQAETMRCAGEWDRDADWALEGALSPRSWLAHRTSLGRWGASRLVRSARFTRQHQATGEALAGGDISCAHLDVLASMSRDRETEFVRHEETLLDAAEALSPDDFSLIARRWRDIADDELSKLEARERHERRHLHVCTTLYGMGMVDGELDADGVATVLEALDLAAPPIPSMGSPHRAPGVSATPMASSTSAVRSSLPRARAAGRSSVSPSSSTATPWPARATLICAVRTLTSIASVRSRGRPRSGSRVTAPSAGS